MVLAIVLRSLAVLRRLDVPFVLFWSAYVAIWPGALWWSGVS